MKICHVLSLFSPEHGGPTYAVGNYCKFQIASGNTVSLVAMEGFPGDSPAVRLPAPVNQVVLRVGVPAKLGRCPLMIQTLRGLDVPDVYHVHGAWHLALRDAVKVAREQRVPVLLELMGSYSDYEFRRKSLRKWVARMLYQDDIVKGVQCIHANSHMEARFLRGLGVNIPIAVIPVGVEVTTAFTNDGGAAYRLVPAEWDGCQWMLFLARIHPTKGIDMLLRAWALALRCNTSWRLLIAGHGDAIYVATVKSLVRELGIEHLCRFVGKVSDTEKEWAYRNADAYILPSRQENFGNTVAEAMAFHCPVATTSATPWGLLEVRRCGWISAPKTEDIAKMLTRVASTSSCERKAMGMRGRHLVEAEFSLEFVQKSLARVYGWLKGGERPDEILFDAGFRREGAEV